ncbi:hypothetical protein M406DRAFT_100610 [Cryphonectria parasitica EP155]|uniref:Uncharacterized protein n=1 Tax=Cryphonectria parasitica (strain ATCC 38755 / EP155) TaxID=660469 RepID=A0A9P4YBD3_CRYP1|nr:uncharacterized protein M406DRAFT_100610 [Cryphonectria parasitica EP155]KAF3769889.1 hypothetical protein M406DRAFT_100610 [Cryphonectria parasitica EP155]
MTSGRRAWPFWFELRAFCFVRACALRHSLFFLFLLFFHFVSFFADKWGKHVRSDWHKNS